MTQPLNLNQDTMTFDPASAIVALRLDQDADDELSMRRAMGKLHRQVLTQEGSAASTPDALTTVGMDDSATYAMWLPRSVHCGTASTDPVSGHCGTASIDAIHLRLGDASE
jgi:hypothetical protein